MTVKPLVNHGGFIMSDLETLQEEYRKLASVARYSEITEQDRVRIVELRTLIADAQEKGWGSETSDPNYVICPHCGTQMGDCWEWVRAEPLTDNCSTCGDRFTYWAVYDVTYYAEKA